MGSLGSPLKEIDCIYFEPWPTKPVQVLAVTVAVMFYVFFTTFDKLSKHDR